MDFHSQTWKPIRESWPPIAYRWTPITQDWMPTFALWASNCCAWMSTRLRGDPQFVYGHPGILRGGPQNFVGVHKATNWAPTILRGFPNYNVETHEKLWQSTRTPSGPPTPKCGRPVANLGGSPRTFRVAPHCLLCGPK